MRWQQLFADLAAQFDEAEVAVDRAEAASHARAEMGAVRLADRLGGALGSPVTLHCRGPVAVAGALTGIGVDWLLLLDEQGRENLVAAAAVRSATGLGRQSAAATERGPVQARLDLRRAMRALARDRRAVQVLVDDGRWITGTVDRVGADFVEIAEHAVDELRRARAVRDVQAVVVEALVVVRRAAADRD